MKPRRRGFTLIELLVVITIITLLVALLIPWLQSVYQTAKEYQCQRHIGQLAAVVAAYCQQNDGLFPVVGYADVSVGFIDPSAGDWLFVGLPISGQLDTPSLNRGVLVRNKMIEGADIFFCPFDVDAGLVRPDNGLVQRSSSVSADYVGATSYVINASISYGDYGRTAYNPSNNITWKSVHVRRMRDFRSTAFLFFEQAVWIDPTMPPMNFPNATYPNDIYVNDAPYSQNDQAFMIPDSSNYHLTNRHRGGGYVACMDGHVERINQTDFDNGMNALLGAGPAPNPPALSLPYDWWFTCRPIVDPVNDTPEDQAAKLLGMRWNPG